MILVTPSQSNYLHTSIPRSPIPGPNISLAQASELADFRRAKLKNEIMVAQYLLSLKKFAEISSDSEAD